MANCFLILGLILIDQISKFFVTVYLKPVGSVAVLDRILNFTYVENTGIAFGMLKDMQFLVIPLTLVITAVLVYLMLKAGKRNMLKLNCSLAVIISGAVGNIIDKIFKGYVVDFIEFGFFDFPVFNFADICVTLGAIAFAAIIIFTEDGEFFADKK